MTNFFFKDPKLYIRPIDPKGKWGLKITPDSCPKNFWDHRVSLALNGFNRVCMAHFYLKERKKKIYRGLYQECRLQEP